jgi:CBS domain-containing protein
MKAVDVMTSPVISVTPETTVREIAALLFERRISGLPVLENGSLVGMVSEADLLHRHEIGTDCIGRNGSWWLRLFSQDRSMENYVKSHAVKARDIMSRDVVSVAEDTPLADIATLFETRGIKRVPVLRAGQLVGIVSRANLVQALAATATEAATAKSDVAIRDRLLDELNRQSWWRDSAANVVVEDGVVHFWGLTYSDEEREAARVAAESVAGVRNVQDHRLAYQKVADWL